MKALDLFAGTGWGVACQWLGIHEYGVEIMPEAVATRDANGMETIFRDIWEGIRDPSLVPGHDILIASPPCQTFSVAGSGAGRDALDEVLAAIEDPEVLQGAVDPRTALVLTPLTYIRAHRPMYVALEQVPSVLPVWQAIAVQLEGLGYSTWTGILSSEEYGVPQVRKRAILIARKDDVPAAAPNKKRQVTLRSIRPDQEGLISNYSTGSGGIRIPGNRLARGYKTVDEPAPTLTSKCLSMKWYPSMENVSIEEACLMQSYPAEMAPSFKKKAALQIGNSVPPLMAKAILETFL